MATDGNLKDIERRLELLERAHKESVKREKVLANRVSALVRELKGLETAHSMLRSFVSQVDAKKNR